MRTVPLLLVVASVALAGCGDDDGDTAATDAPGESAAKKDAATKKDDAATEKDDAATGKDDAATGKDDAATGKDDATKRDDAAFAARGTTITLQDSNFGPMLFDSNKQAIYVFERDSRNKTVCYGDCAEAWPPVFSKGRPQAEKGVRASLLGTIKRRDGRTQVTYAGKPLYFYAHEDPGVVLCHNVNLNGGYWWAIGADGKRRPS
jgi:predicted lipoprotein with Yx(FWY)xxD motif